MSPKRSVAAEADTGKAEIVRVTVDTELGPLVLVMSRFLAVGLYVALEVALYGDGPERKRKR